MTRPVTSAFAALGPAMLGLTILVISTMAAVYPASAGTSVTNIVMTPAAPAVLEYGTHIEVTFDYETDVPGGVWIGFLPFTEGSRTPTLFHSGGPYYPVGSGSGSFWFTLSSGDHVIDEIHVEMYDDQLTYLGVIILPCTYLFVESGTITNIVMDPVSPATLFIDDHVDVYFDFTAPETVKFFTQPFTSGSNTPGGAHSGSGTHPPGSGSASRWFTITWMPVEVDAVEIVMTSTDESTEYIRFYVPVEYTYDATVPASPSTWGILKTKY